MAIGEKKPVVMEFDRAVPGGVATLDENGKLVESQRVVKSNPNLLINWYFPNPVNRNGKTEYADIGYAIDMWRKTSTEANGVLLVEKTGLIAKSGSPVIRQYFEDKPVYVGKTLTASILFGNNELLTATQTVTAETFRALYTSRLYFDSNASKNEVFAVTVPADRHVIAAKLELGSVQTLAHQDEGGNWVLNEIPNYAEQYAICEQYSPITGEFVGGQHSNENLLDNWYFADPINQRGQKEYKGNVYTIDRWYKYYGASADTSLVIDDDGITTSDNNVVIRYRVEDREKYIGKTLTFSVLIKNAGCFFVTSTPTAPTLRFVFDGSRAYFSTTQVVPNELVAISIPPGDHLIAAKLELGSVQTLARKVGDEWVLNDPPPNKATELAKCQRYFEMWLSLLLSREGEGNRQGQTFH